MKSYLSIDNSPREDIYVYGFDKLDGSQIRAEWSSKKGFYKFGTRNVLIDSNTRLFGRAIPLIHDKYEASLSSIFKNQNWTNVVCFFEFYGANSFAGNHFEDEQQTITLFDVNPYKQGILEPAQFIKLFGELEIPKILFSGKVNSDIISQIKNSTLEGMSCEGVVFKGQNDKKTKMPIMFKIKSQAWLNKLKTFCKGDENLFIKLA